jgi:hypothetical protein
VADKRAPWRLPPDSWYKTQPPDRPVQECIREYYKAHPEHKPPPDVLTALRKLPPSLSELRAHEARHGDPDHLIQHLRGGNVRGLSAAEIDILVGLLEAARGQRARDRERRVRDYLITAMYEKLRAQKVPIKQIEHRVMERFGCKRTTIYNALKAHKQRRGLV